MGLVATVKRVRGGTPAKNANKANRYEPTKNFYDSAAQQFIREDDDLGGSIEDAVKYKLSARQKAAAAKFESEKQFLGAIREHNRRVKTGEINTKGGIFQEGKHVLVNLKDKKTGRVIKQVTISNEKLIKNYKVKAIAPKEKTKVYTSFKAIERDHFAIEKLSSMDRIYITKDYAKKIGLTGRKVKEVQRARGTMKAIELTRPEIDAILVNLKANWDNKRSYVYGKKTYKEYQKKAQAIEKAAYKLAHKLKEEHKIRGYKGPTGYTVAKAWATKNYIK